MIAEAPAVALPTSLTPPRIKRVDAPGPGMYENVPFDEYASWDAMNKSTLSQGEDSMAHLNWALKYGREYTSKSLDFGTAVHLAALEPHEFVLQVVKKPAGMKLTTKAGKAWKTENEDKIILSDAEYDNALRSSENIRRHPDMRPLLDSGRVMREVAVVWRDDDTGVLMKCRVDLAIKSSKRIILPDIKTTRSSDPFSFGRSIAAFGYDMQAAIIQDGIKATVGSHGEFWLVTVEKPAGQSRALCPVDIYRPCKKTVDSGRVKYKRLLVAYVECCRTGVWPSRTNQVTDITIPEWSMVSEDAD